MRITRTISLLYLLGVTVLYSCNEKPKVVPEVSKSGNLSKDTIVVIESIKTDTPQQNLTKRCSWCSQNFEGLHFAHYKKRISGTLSYYGFTHCYLSNSRIKEDWHLGIFCSELCCNKSRQVEEKLK